MVYSTPTTKYQASTMNLNQYGSQIASIVDLELFQNQCGMIYTTSNDSKIIASKLANILKSQNVNFELVHASSIISNQRMLDNLELTTAVNIVCGFEDLTCFFNQCLDKVLNPNLFTNQQFLSKTQQDFIDCYQKILNIDFERAITKDPSITSMMFINHDSYQETCLDFEQNKLLSEQELASIYGLIGSCYIQGLNFKPFTKFVIILPQQLAKIIYEFKPYHGLFDFCKDGYGVLGLDSNFEYLKTFGHKSSYQGDINSVVNNYSEALNALYNYNRIVPS